ncbi:S41 family peptidase [Paenibacillus sp. WQ 127069]|uniref:S41 family peptidase n=1 Tax=Paenibacillus baimaensis TaxID=2982185 RepID=A0ABT2UC87_9BACL|nr:S41 family peptidase [Paenibacillus sp. WQ 127069]MCU6792202.1 S41 family peptidase [Paenibacillus sp. WQ 127069]
MSLIQDIIDSLKWLTAWEMILCALYLFVLLRYAMPILKNNRWFYFIPSLGVIIASISLINGDASMLALLIYSSTAILFLCTVRGIFKPAIKPMSPKFRIVMVFVCVLGSLPTLLALTIAGEVRYNPVSDLSHKSYSKAFIAMNERLSAEYPFGDWKKIDWEAKRNKFEPLFLQAEINQDPNLYYKTLRDYLFSFRDGHIKIVNEHLYDDNNAFKNEVGGGVGISAIRLDNGKVLVSLLLAGSPADKCGIKLGAEIISWDGKDVQKALDQTSWSENPSATEGDRIQNQGRFLARAPIGKEIQVKFRNRDDQAIMTETLTAYDDQYETLKKTKLKLKKEDPPVEGEILRNEYGYVKFKYFLPGTTQSDPAKALEDKLKEFQEKRVKGIIIDLRDNPGGDDDLVAQMAGHFVNEKKIFEYVSYYNRNTGRFEINRSETRTVQPSQIYFPGEIAVLINHNTASSGEGLPLLLKGMPNVKIIGFMSTNGSFGVVSAPIEIKMPGGYGVRFPDGRSLNKDKKIQGDSDERGQGGVTPDITVPMNEQTFKMKVIEGQDVELNYALASFND